MPSNYIRRSPKDEWEEFLLVTDLQPEQILFEIAREKYHTVRAYNRVRRKLLQKPH